MSSKMEIEYEFKFENKEDYYEIVNKVKTEAAKLRNEMEKVSLAFKNAANSQEDAATELSAYSAEVKESVDHIEKLGSEFSKTIKSIDDAQKKADFKDTLKSGYNFLTGAVSLIIDLEASTREYRMLVANLESSSIAAGYAIEDIAS